MSYRYFSRVFREIAPNFTRGKCAVQQVHTSPFLFAKKTKISPVKPGIIQSQSANRRDANGEKLLKQEVHKMDDGIDYDQLEQKFKGLSPEAINKHLMEMDEMDASRGSKMPNQFQVDDDMTEQAMNGVSPVDMMQELAGMKKLGDSPKFMKFVNSSPETLAMYKEIQKMEADVSRMTTDGPTFEDAKKYGLMPDAMDQTVPIPDYAQSMNGEVEVDLDDAASYPKKLMPEGVSRADIRQARQATADLEAMAPGWPWPKPLTQPMRMALMVKFSMNLESNLPDPSPKVHDQRPIYKAKLIVPVDELGLDQDQKDIFIKIVGQRYHENKNTVTFISREKFDAEANEDQVFEYLRKSLEHTLRLDKEFKKTTPKKIKSSKQSKE